MSSIDLRLGDCLDVLKNIPDNSVDLVVTDPPYDIHAGFGGGIMKGHDKEYLNQINTMSSGFSTEALDEICRIIKKINCYFFCSKKQIIPLTDYFVKQKKCNWDLLVWCKTNPVPACCNKYLTDKEYILFFREKGVKILGSFSTKKTYYITPLNQKDKKIYGHPTIKPLEIVENLIINSSLEGWRVLDPFMGSGTTGVACKRLKRDFIGIEIDQNYFATAKERIDKTDDDESDRV